MNQTEVKKNKTKRNIIIGASCLIVVVAIILLCYFLIPRSTQRKFKLDISCTNCSIDNASEFHGEYSTNEKLSITFKADFNCVLPSDVNAKIGDMKLEKDKDYSYSYDTGVLNINLKGDTSVTIGASCNILSFDVNIPANSSFDVGFAYNKDLILNESTYPGVVDWGDGTKDNKLSHHYGENSEERNYSISIYDYSHDYFSFNNLSSKDNIKAIFIPTNVSKISERCFANFNGLHSVVFASDCKMTSISDFAFLRCDSLSSVILPKGLTLIGDNAFSSCGSLQTINIPNTVSSIGYSAFANCSKLDKIVFEEDSQLTTIGNFAFSDSALSSIAFPSGTSAIGEGAFSECKKLTSVIFPESVITLSDYAFFACPSLDTIFIPKTITNIGFLAFSTGVESITPYIYCEIGAKPQAWHNNWTTKGSVVYWNSFSIGSNNIYKYVIHNIDGNKTISLVNYISGNDPVDIIIPSAIEVAGTAIPVTGIGENIFKDCSTLTSVSIPNSISNIGANAFSNCTSLKTVVFEQGLRLTHVGDYAFYNDNRITNEPVVVISKDMISIGDYAFSGVKFQFTLEDCSQLTNIGDYGLYNATFTSPTSFVFSDCLTSIGEFAFAGNRNLTSVAIPDSLTFIGTGAFQSCSLLEEVTFEEGVQLTSINDRVFYNDSKLSSIEIPSSITSIGDSSFYGSGLTSITIPNGVSSIGNGAFSSCRQLTEVVFEPGIQLNIINENVFSSCNKLASIAIPSSITSIGSYAFSNCSALTSITIPKSVTSIGERTFASCTYLAEVIFEDGGAQLTNVGSYAFYSTKKLISIDLPVGIESIGESVFSSSGLKTISLPNHITSIGLNAYNGCTSLTEFSCDADSKLEIIGEKAFFGCNSLNSIIIPNSVSLIDIDAFYRINASAVIDMTKLDHVIELGGEIFDNNNFKGTIKVSKNMEDDYKGAEIWNKYAARIIGVE